MRLLNFNIIRLFVFLVIGILIAYHFPIDTTCSLYTSVLLISLMGISWFYLRQKVVRKPYFALLTYLSMISLGISTYTIHKDINREHHYSNFLNLNTKETLVLRLKERLKPNAYSIKYIAEVVICNEQLSEGQVLVNIEKDSFMDQYRIDDYLFTNTKFNTIPSPLNPHQFNYRSYLELKNVHHQIYVNTDELLKLQAKRLSIYGHADRLRLHVNHKLSETGLDPNTMSIINAMVMGQRQDIDRSIYNNYVNSGTIHILAVSGLHVGIILLILNSLFKPLLYLRYGRYLRPTIIIIMMWLFAVIAGLSPSVTRAVCMFSVISIAMHLKRPTNIYNTLIISAFLLLLFRPDFLFQVGFQMSYLAVLGIVSIQPKLYSSIKFKFWVADKLWQIFTVTIAAQIAVLPISLYYFHQFPGLFFISNLVVIPFLGLILGLGLLVVALSLLNSLPQFLVFTYDIIIKNLNDFIAWIATFEEFLFRDISFDIFQVMGWYLIIIATVQIYQTKRTLWLVLTLSSIIGLQFYALYHKLSPSEKFIIFNKNRYTVIGNQCNNKLYLHHNMNGDIAKEEQFVRNYKVGERLSIAQETTLENVYQFMDEHILIVDSVGIYDNISFKPAYVLLRNSPKINLNRLIERLNPSMVVADASNYKTYVERWKTSCQLKGIKFHYTNEQGAFILE